VSGYISLTATGSYVPRGLGPPPPRPEPSPATAEQVVAALVAQLAEHSEALTRSVLDGTVSCRTCRALVLESNRDGHDAWHARDPAYRP
jgi:hypothetical protein